MAPRMRPFGDVRIEEQGRLNARGTRRPHHSFYVEAPPFSLQPFAIAPVLAGDTLKSHSLNVRVLTNAITNRVSGWWFETWLFYVRLLDLPTWSDMQSAVVDPADPLTGQNLAVTDWLHHRNANYPSFAHQALQVCTRAYFRDEGEAWDAALDAAGRPKIATKQHGWWDSVKNDTVVGPATGDDEWEENWSIYQKMRAAKLTTMTYREFLAQSGVRVPPQLEEPVEDYRIPELLRHTQDFAQPVLTSLTSGSSAGNIVANCQWTIADRGDSKRAFAEPGFILGLMAVRPKVFFSTARTAAVDIICSEAEGWMPSEYESDPHMRLEEETGSTVAGAATGPIHNSTATYWWDRADLFLQGDQFTSLADSVMGGGAAVKGLRNIVDLPTADNQRYPSDSNIVNMFADTVAGVYNADGILNLSIASRIKSDATE